MKSLKEYFLYYEVRKEISTQEFSINDLRDRNKETLFKLIENNSLQKLNDAYTLSLQRSEHNFPSGLVIILQALFNAFIIFSPISFISSTKFTSKLWTASSKDKIAGNIIDNRGIISAILIIFMIIIILLIFYTYIQRVKLSKLSNLLKNAISYKKNFLSLGREITNIKQDLEILNNDFPDVFDQFYILHNFLQKTSDTTNDLVVLVYLENLIFELKDDLYKLRAKKIKHSLNNEEKFLLQDIKKCYSSINKMRD